MTLQELENICAVLNENRHRGYTTWFSNGDYIANKFEHSTASFTPFEAAAIAEKYSRNKSMAALDELGGISPFWRILNEGKE